MAYLIRHAPPADSVRGTCYGQSDIELSMSFEAAAQIVKKNLPNGVEPSRIITSDLQRCEKLAQALLPYFPAASMAATPALREVNFGLWEGLSWTNIEIKFPKDYQVWMHNWQTLRPSGQQAESLPDLTDRIDQWLKKNALNLDAKTLVITHAGPIRAILHLHPPYPNWPDLFEKNIPFLTPIPLDLKV